MTWTAALCVLTALTASACAASGNAGDPNAPRTVEEYIRHAALANVGLKAAFEEWRAALAAMPQVKVLPDPRFTYGYFVEEVETRVGPQRQRFGLMQAFPWFGTIEARTDAVASTAKAAQRRYEARKLEVFHDVKDGFYEYVYLAGAIGIARESLELVRHFEEVARTKYITAEAGHPDVIRAQMELAVLEDKLATLQAMRGPIVARLNAALNRPTGSALPWPQRHPYQTHVIERKRVLALLKRQNPQLQALDFQLDGARSRVTLAEKKFYPDLAVGVDWIDTDDAAAAGVRDSGKDPVILMFSMNLPLWRKSYGAAELQARATTRRLAHQKADLANNLVARAERILYDFEDSERKIKLYGGTLVPKAEALLGASESAYSAGTVDFLALLDAERTLLEFKLMNERALADREQKLAELEMVVGGTLSVPGPSNHSN